MIHWRTASTSLVLLVIVLAAPTPAPCGGPELLAPGSRQPGAAAAERDAGRPPTATAIAAFELRVARRPQDAVSRALLGKLYLRRAAETGGLCDSVRAETVLREALDLLPDYAPALSALAAALLAQHRFSEAMTTAERALARDSRDLDSLATVGDARLAVGRYDEAARAYEELRLRDGSPATLAGLARLAELRGELVEAFRLTEEAAALAVRGGDPGERAWHLVRLGHLSLDHGKTAAAADYCERALSEGGGTSITLVALAEVRATQNRTGEAIELYRRAPAIRPEPAILIALGHLYEETGEPDRAGVAFLEAERLIADSARPEAYRRELSRLLAARGVEPERALALAQADLSQRADVYAWDTLTWALYRTGRIEEAAEASERALALGTRDALLHYHAGMIAARQGRQTTAREHSRTALGIDPNLPASISHEIRLIVR